MINRFCILTFLGMLGLAALAPAQTLARLYSFCSRTGCADGSTPYAGLLLTADGNFVGTTYTGGSHDGGTVFRIDLKGTLKTIYSFCSQTSCADGSNPYAGLLQGPSHNFYGTAESGGAAGAGSVFKLTPSGTLTVVHSFDGSDGFSPYAGLVRTPDGNLYGTTGGSGSGTNISGTVFKITPAGKLTTLHLCSRTNCTDGANPWGTLVEAKDGNFYGTTAAGGTHVCKTRGQEKIGCGTVFKITPEGKLTTLYNFCSRGGSNCTDGYRVDLQTSWSHRNTRQWPEATRPKGPRRRSPGSCGVIFKLANTGKLTAWTAPSRMRHWRKPPPAVSMEQPVQEVTPTAAPSSAYP